MNDFHGRIQNLPTNATGTGEGQQITAPGLDGAYGTSDDKVEIVGGSAHVAATVKRLQTAFGPGGESRARGSSAPVT